MIIKKLLEIESIVCGRKTPSDMNDDSLNAHYSKSRGEEIKILDMHLPHLVRAYSNMIDYDKEWHDKSYNEGWNDALESLKK
jgi:hypothetical protein|tara:strand:+ start:295 stop:540 length:246 start_codon:yes stop_codon:yes gene_type:complete